MIDARRGEAFAAATSRARTGVRELLGAARARARSDLAALLEQARAARRGRRRWLAVGDGALRYRGELEAAGVEVPADALAAAPRAAPRRSASWARAPRARRLERACVPDYRRRPDAELALERRGGRRPGDERATVATELASSTRRPPPSRSGALSYPDLPQVIAIERRVFPTPWSLAMFVLELSKQSGICLAALSRRDGCVGYLICSRYDTVWHVMNVAVDLEPPAPGARLGAARRALRARGRRRGALHARGAPLQPVAIHLYEREGFRAAGHAPPLLPGQRRGRARDVAHAGDARRARSTTCPTPAAAV